MTCLLPMSGRYASAWDSLSVRSAADGSPLGMNRALPRTASAAGIRASSLAPWRLRTMTGEAPRCPTTHRRPSLAEARTKAWARNGDIRQYRAAATTCSMVVAWFSMSARRRSGYIRLVPAELGHRTLPSPARRRS